MTKHVPADWPTVVPRIAVKDPEGLVRFIQQVFGASGEVQSMRPSELRLGDSLIMVGSAIEREVMTAFLYVYVEDTDGHSRWRSSGTPKPSKNRRTCRTVIGAP